MTIAEITVCSPTTCSKEVIDRFVQLICTGGAIPGEAKRIYKRVRGAKALAFLQIGDKIVGIAALKIPADSYRARIGKSAGVLLSKKDHPYELGYVVVDAAMRGQKLSQKLVNALLPLADGKCMFATTSSVAMHRVLPRAGFLKTGREYENDKGEKLTLYVTKQR